MDEPDENFECEACGGIYRKGWTTEEAEAESDRIFGKMTEEERAILCDACFQRLLSMLN